MLRRDFFKALALVIIPGPAKHQEKTNALNLEDLETFSFHQGSKPLRIWFDGKEVFELTQMLASPDPSQLVFGAIRVCIIDSKGQFKCKRRGKYEVIEQEWRLGMVRWERLEQIKCKIDAVDSQSVCEILKKNATKIRDIIRGEIRR